MPLPENPAPALSLPEDGSAVPSNPSKKGKRRSRSYRAIVPHLNLTASRWALLPVLLVVWLAPFLGGSVEAWSMGVLYCLLAAVFIIYPVTYQVKMRYRLFLALLLVAPLLAFLPVAFTGVPAWRTDLLARFHLSFPGTITPQPWLTLDSYLAWLGGVAWIYWLGGQGWTREVRKPLAELFAIGMIALTVIGLIGYHTQHPLPFWHAQRLFGPFPNRNQTADLLGLTFVLLVALLHMAVAKKSRMGAVWAIGLLAVGYGLIINFSRAGIILPLLGVAVYWCLTVLTHPSRKKLWIGVAALFLVLALFLAFGGETLDRFVKGDNGQSVTADFRRLIFRDTLAMTFHHPWLGFGLSGFPAVFPVFRKLAAVDSGIIHPESDWLWLASEVGWPVTLLILGACGWFVWRAFVGAYRRPHPLRLISAICAGLFVLHGFFDVSGHRFGTFFPACFLFALAWPGQMTEQKISPRRSQGIALGLVLIATGWFINVDAPPFWPNRNTLALTRRHAAQEIGLGHGAEAFALVDAALRWAPLDWQLYYQRGVSRILQRRDWAASLRDFQIANHLERFSPLTPEREGVAWLSYRPELAALSWAEALQRMPREESDRAYARYLDLAAPYPRLRSQLEALAGKNVPRLLIQLNHVDQSEFPALLAGFLREHAPLDRLKPAEQRVLFDIWVGRGKPAEALARLQKDPRLLPACNIPLARAHGRLKHYQQACEIFFKTLPKPEFPQLQLRSSEEEMSRIFYLQNSLGSGMALYQSQLARRDSYAAIATLQHLQTLRDAPRYLSYFEAQLQGANGNWEKCWACLDDYVNRNQL